MVSLEKCSDIENSVRNKKINVFIPYLKEILNHKAEIQTITKLDSTNRYFKLPSGYELELSFGICAAIYYIIALQKAQCADLLEYAENDQNIHYLISLEIKEYFKSWKYFEGRVNSPISGGIDKYIRYVDNQLNQYGSCAYGQLRWNLIKHVCNQLELSIYGGELKC